MTTNLMTELVSRREVFLAATGFSISTMWLLSRRTETILSANEVLPNMMATSEQQTNEQQTTKKKQCGPMHKYSITYGAELNRRPSNDIFSAKAQLNRADEAAGQHLKRRPSWSAKFEGHKETLPEATKAEVRTIISSNASKVPHLLPPLDALLTPTQTPG